MSEVANRHEIGTYSSWTIESETVALKKCDKSVLEHNMSHIPYEICWFFRADSLELGKSRTIKLYYDKKEYEAYLHKEKRQDARVQIHWYKNLGMKILKYKKSGSVLRLRFERIEDDTYDFLVLDDTKLDKKAIEIARVLLTLVVNGQTKITYSALSDMTESKPSAYFEMNHLLDEINRCCYNLGLPCISAIVINKKTGLPGKGFRQLCIDAFGYDSSMSLRKIVDEELKKIEQCDSWNKLAECLEIKMPIDNAKLPEEVDELEGEPIIEGAKKTIVVNSYERDPQAKKKCKDYYLNKDGRIICQICGFDFGKVYGPEYNNMIHVHHIIPLSDIGKEYIVDPVNDLIPICPNCHMVLHAGEDISVEQLKKRLKAYSDKINSLVYCE